MTHEADFFCLNYIVSECCRSSHKSLIKKNINRNEIAILINKNVNKYCCGYAIIQYMEAKEFSSTY
jgi:hypothetical protein